MKRWKRGNEFAVMFDVCNYQLKTLEINMTTTVLELITNLKRYPGATKVVIKDVNDVEFAIIDFESEGDGVNIVIDEKESEKNEG